MIDGNNDTEIAQISVGESPSHLLVLGNKIYVANSGSNTVSVINSSQNPKGRHDIVVGNGPSDIAYNDMYRKIYVANSKDNTVSVINASNDKPEPNAIRVGNYPTSIALDGDTIYVLNSNSVPVINYISDSVMVGVTLNIHPYNSGTLTCYKVRIPTNPNLITISIPTNIFFLSTQERIVQLNPRTILDLMAGLRI